MRILNLKSEIAQLELSDLGREGHAVEEAAPAVEDEPMATMVMGSRLSSLRESRVSGLARRSRLGCVRQIGFVCAPAADGPATAAASARQVVDTRLRGG